jgi:hypothetical protein
MGTKPDYADKFFQARAAQTAARDHFYVTLRRFLEKHGDVTDAIAAATKAAARAKCTIADLKPLVRSFARTDYAIGADSQFGELVAAERMPKKRKQKAGADVGSDVNDAPQAN